MLRLLEIAPDGVLRRADAFCVSDLPMVHDFAVTAERLVFLVLPLVYDAQRSAAGASDMNCTFGRPKRDRYPVQHSALATLAHCAVLALAVEWAAWPAWLGSGVGALIGVQVAFFGNRALTFAYRGAVGPATFALNARWAFAPTRHPG
jgi:hypothetical protein